MGQINAIAHYNELTKDVTNDLYVTPQVNGVYDPDAIIARMKKKEIATKNVDGKAFLNNFFNECCEISAEGGNIITPFFRSSLGIQGVVYTEDLGHNIPADRLNVSLNLTAGELARKAIAGSTVYVFEQAGATGPSIQTVMDPTEKVADHLNPGSMVLIQGMRLALKGDDASVGIRFINSDDATKQVTIAPAKVYPNTPTNLQFTLPAEVTEGKWLVSVTTQASGSSGTLLKTPRMHQFQNIITVGNPSSGEDDRPVID